MNKKRLIQFFIIKLFRATEFLILLMIMLPIVYFFMESDTIYNIYYSQEDFPIGYKWAIVWITINLIIFLFFVLCTFLFCTASVIVGIHIRELIVTRLMSSKMRLYLGIEKPINKSSEVNTNDGTALVSYLGGTSKIGKEDYLGAIADYNKAIEIDPSFAASYFGRGISKTMLKDHIGAIADYNMAIEIDPNYSEAFWKRGAEKSKLQDYNGAIEDFNKSIEINPNAIEVFNDRAVLKYNLKDYLGAIEDLSKVIEVDPKFPNVYYNRGNAKCNIQDYAGSIKDYGKAIEINPNDAYAYYNRSCSKDDLQDHEGADEDYKKAILINPNLRS